MTQTQMRIEILERLALMGPNIYANRPCIKWKIDLGPFEERPSNEIAGFAERLKAAVPSLYEHRCSEGEEGGFFSRLESGTWFGHIMEHVALELQNLVGCDVGFGKTRGAGPVGVYNVIYECEERETGILAGEIARDLLEHLAAGADYPLDAELARLRETHERHALGPSTKSIVDAAVRRGIPYIRMDEWNLVQLGYGANAKRIQATIASTTRYLGVEMAGDKDLTKSMLSFHGIAVPPGEITREFEEAKEIAERIGWPVVVKPLDASQGRGIVTNVGTIAELEIAFKDAKKYRSTILIEKHLEGSDYRLLVINNKLVAAAQRIPAHVVGDGTHTIEELAEIVNEDPRRGESHEKVLTRIKIDELTEELLAIRGMNRATVPLQNQVVYLKTTANLSTGGTAVDVTDSVHPSVVDMAERIACLLDLNIAGIDVVAPRIDRPLEESGGGVVEVNAAPGFRMHLAPTIGKPRAVGEAVIDMLFPPGVEARIPIITVTGTNGKTTTARLCAHIAKQAGKCVGLTTTDGIYIRNQRVQKGDTTGPMSAAVVLRDPSVNFAVLETARGGILRAGVGYDWANTAVVTNIAEDHLGLRDVHTVEDLARVKAVTVSRVMPEGYAILNAEDEMMPVIREEARCNISYFSLDPANEIFRQHVEGGGPGATLEDGWIVLYDRSVRIVLCEAWRVPISFEGRADFNIANTLAAVAATFATGIGISEIIAGITTFFPSATHTPGRMNILKVGNFEVVIDYGHNPHAVAALSKFVASIKKARTIAVIGMPGDRRDEDIRKVAAAAADSFDAFVIREDHDLRERRPGEVAAILEQALLAAGVNQDAIIVELDNNEAFLAAARMARAEDIIVFMVDKADEAIAMVEAYRNKEGRRVSERSSERAEAR